MASLNIIAVALVYAVCMKTVSAGKLITTEDNYVYKDIGGDFSGSTSVSFTVKACNDAHITLQPETADAGIDEYGFEIVLGGWRNSRSVIRSRFQDNELDVYNGRVLSCTQPRSFWVSWAGGKIRVGTGHVIAESAKFMEANIVKTVTVSTGWGSTGVWAFIQPNEAHFMHTADEYKYQIVPVDFSNQSAAVFLVQACNDAHISLQSVTSKIDEAAYEIVIGGWGDSKSVIRSGQQSSQLAENAGSHLNCDVAKPFWVSWVDNQIRVGEGYDVSGSAFLAAPLVRNIGVSTGWGATGVWHID